MKITIPILRTCFLLLLLISCSTPEPISNEESARLAFENAKGYQKAGRYELALEKFNYVKNKFPFTNYAVEAEVEVANTYFLQGEYLAAIASYESFRDLHPQNKNLPFVANRIGESFFNNAPSSVDKDLTPIKKGIKAYEDLIQTYPRSEYVKDAREQIKIGKGKLAEKEIYIGDYYFRKKEYQAAANRFQNVLEHYPKSNHDSEASYKQGECYLMLGKKDEAKKVFNLAANDTDSIWGTKASGQLKGLQ